MGEVSDFKFGT